jgi:hypothetical protein
MERRILETPEALWSLKTQVGGPPLLNGPALSEAA